MRSGRFLSRTPRRRVGSPGPHPVLHIRYNPHSLPPIRDQALTQVLGLLAEGHLVAFPTETVWGLAARADIPEAIDKIFELKGRPRDRTLPCFVPSAEVASRYIEGLQTPLGRQLTRHWPGPLTVVAPATPEGRRLPVVASDGTLGLRVPKTPFLLALLPRLEVPLACTSANLSGSPTCRSWADTVRMLGHGLAAVVHTVDAQDGSPSTVVRIEGSALRILRQGSLILEDPLTADRPAGVPGS